MKAAKPESMGFSSERLNRIDEMIKGYIERGQIAGASAVISRKDHVVYSRAFGYAHLDKKIPIVDNTIFRIYSMSKPITVAAAMILYEKGLFSLDDPISRYIPSFTDLRVLTGFDGDTPLTRPAKTDMTVRHLFTMTSGLSYGFGDEGLDKYYNDHLDPFFEGDTKPSLETFSDKLAGFPLLFDPGEGYNYSFSIDIIGRLIEVLSGKPLSRFLSDEIFKPLKMHDTGFHVPSTKKNRFSQLYEWNGKKLVANKSKDLGDFSRKPTFEMAGGGLVSTLEDYSRFCQMLLHKGELDDVRILSPKTVDLMSQNHLDEKLFKHFIENEKKGYGYGLGVRVLKDPAKAGLNSTPGEWGWDGMASTWMCIDPEENLTAVFMIQLIPYNCFPLMTRFQQMMYSALVN